MQVSKTKTARFSEVVKGCGKPVAVVLWTEPAEDRAFSAALKQNRVMTVKEAETGARTDFGVVGFSPGPTSRYLTFPKALTKFKDKRIIGIKYELLETAEPVGRVVEPGPAPRPKPARYEKTTPPPAVPVRAHRKPAVAAKARKRFRVTVRFTATVDTVQELDAENRKEAKAKAEAAAERPDFAAGKLIKRVVRIESAKAG